MVSRLWRARAGQIVDKEDQGGGACSGFGHAVLRVFEAQKLFDVAKANFQGPT